MPLPSSAPQHGLNVALGRNNVNLAAYTPDPDKVLRSMSLGMKVADQLSDGVILRPKEVMAQAAAADAMRQGQINQEMAAMADRSNIAIRAANAGQVLNTDTIKNDSDRVEAALLNKVLSNPENQTSKIQAYNLGVNTAEQLAGGVNIKARGDTARAPTDVKIADIRQGGELRAAPLEAQSRELQANTKFRGDEIASNLADTFEYQDLGYKTGMNAARLAGGQSEVAIAPYQNENAMAAMKLGETAGKVGAAYQQTVGLARMINSGGSGAGLPPEAVKSLYDMAEKMKISPVDGAGNTRTLQEMSQLIARKANVEEAAEPLKAVRAESEAATKNLEIYQGIAQLLPGTDTGGLLALPGAEIYNNVAAGWGNLSAEANQQLITFQNRLVVTAANGKLGGGISNADVDLMKKAFPGITQSNTLNQSLVAAGIVMNNRISQRNEFYNAMVPSMGMAGADRMWDQYLKANPIFDSNKSGKGVLTFSDTSMTPQQYFAAIKDPEQAKQNMMPTNPDVIKSLSFDTPRNPTNSPYVIDPNTNRPKANPSYWSPIEAAHVEVFPPAPVQQSRRDQSTMDQIARTFGPQGN